MLNLFNPAPIHSRGSFPPPGRMGPGIDPAQAMPQPSPRAAAGPSLGFGAPVPMMEPGFDGPPVALQSEPSFAERLTSGIQDSSGMLMALGGNLMAHRMDASVNPFDPQALMLGMRLDEKRRDKKKEEEKERRGRRAAMNLFKQFGYTQKQATDIIDAGFGEEFLKAGMERMHGNRKAPKLELLYDPDSGQPYKAAWDPQLGEYVRVGGIRQQNRSTIEGIRQKIASGSPLTAGEQQVYDDALRADPLMRMLFGGGAGGGGVGGGAAGPGAAGNIPPAAMQFLRQNANDPEVRRQFDEKYGRGAAARVLGR